jgi:hypothetical protein
MRDANRVRAGIIHPQRRKTEEMEVWNEPDNHDPVEFMDWFMGTTARDRRGKKMKTLTIRKHASTSPIVLANGDRMDAVAELHDDNSALYWQSSAVNTEPTVNYQGGSIAPQVCYGIKGRRWDDDSKGWNGRMVIKMFKPIGRLAESITDHTDLSDDEMTLPSCKPNPAHAGAMIIQYPQVHACGSTGTVPSWNWSEGCQTIYNAEGAADVFMAQIRINEVIKIVII